MPNPIYSKRNGVLEGIERSLEGGDDPTVAVAGESQILRWRRYCLLRHGHLGSVDTF